MSNINITDLLVRLQLTGCKFSELASSFADDLKFGRKCAKLNQQNLLLLNTYIEILECYEVSVKSTGIITSNRTILNDTVEFFVDGASISGVVVLSGITNTSIIAIANAINNYQSDYRAILITGATYSITLEGPCDAGTLTRTLSSAATNMTVTGFTGGACKTNCITEDQAQSVIDKISKLTKLCFQSIGFEYTES